jgi:hypothetical protein
MAKTFTPAQAFETESRNPIALTPVESNQVGAIGYDPESKTLAVSFARGAGAIYHYADVSPETHAAFLAGDLGAECKPSIGTYFGMHIKPLPFKKYPAEPAA